MSDLSGRILGGYALREKIGSGGNGDVYRAEHLTLRRTAAIKVLNERGYRASAAAQRFLREAQLAAQLDHPNIAHVYDFGVAEEDGVMWFAMEHIEGVSLAALLRAHGPMKLHKAVPLFVRLAKAVYTAHQRDIVHRDLKPANVMIASDDPKLLDFGIAKGKPAALIEDEEEPSDHPEDRMDTDMIRADRAPGWVPPTWTCPISKAAPRIRPHEQQLTPRGCGIGSRSYMPPEQWCDAAKVGPEADIYALGVMLFEVLRGWPPFHAEDTDGLFRQHCLAIPDPISEEIDRVIRRAMAKSPSARYATALDFARDLERVLQADPAEQLRSLTQQWEAHGRPADLLARGKTLLELHRSTRRGDLAKELGKPEESFLAASLRHARRARWAIGAAVALALMSVLLFRAEGQRRAADQYATATEVERGQQALLHGESSEAVSHLEQAYQRGDHSPGVEFMLARALQPRMSELARFTSSSGRMWSAVFSPDGKRVLTADDKSAQMWDAASSQLLFTMSHGDTVYTAMFSPDGSKILTAGADGTVRIWDADTGTPVRAMTSQRSDAKQWHYYAAAMTSRFAAAIDTMGRAVHVWDTETGAQLAELEGDASEAASLTLSIDGRWLAASGGDDVRVFDTSTWMRVATISGPRVRSIAFDPTGLRLAVGTYDGRASLWEIPSGTNIRCLREAGDPVDAIAFSPDGKLVATGSREGAEQVWDARSGGLRTEFNSHHSKIYAVEFSSTNDLLLSGGADGAVVVSNVASGMPVARLEGPRSFVFTAHFDATARRVVGASSDGTAVVWDAASTYRGWSAPPMGAECDTMESLEPDRRFIALSCRNHGTRVWDTMRGEIVAELPTVTSVEGDYYSAFPAVTADGDRAAIARGNKVEVYALPSGHLLRVVAHSAAVNAVAFAPLGHDLVSGAVDGSLLLTRDDRAPASLPSMTSGIDAVALLADGRVVTADAGAHLRVLDASHITVRMNLIAPFRVRLLRASRDGTRLVTISARSQQAAPALWDLIRHRLVARFEGHGGRVFGARFVADGTMILTAGVDGTARLWDAAIGRQLRAFRGDAHFLVDAAISPDGAMVVAGGSDGMLRFWDVSSGGLLWKLQAHRSYVVGIHYEGDALVTRGYAGDVSRWRLPQARGVIDACQAKACMASEPAGK